ncbi:MAG TPA: C39 family peptidase [Thermoanaerobaculia bacterium]|nr:C39 family peptidase [Thermoanaerobaculia bacterium]
MIATFAAACGGGGGGESPCSPTDPSCGGGGITTPPQAVLSVPYVSQQTQVWCWAAVIEMILRYYSVPATQCQIVSGYVLRQCCAGDPSCFVTASVTTIQAAMYQLGGVQSQWISGPLTFDQVAQEIGAGRPIMIEYRGSFAGHVVLIVGYSRANNLLKIYDPYYGVFDVPYGATFTYGGQMIWASTLVRISR